VSGQTNIQKLPEIDIYVRHSSTCAHKRERDFRDCNCPKWLYLKHIGKRRSAKSRTWTGAERIKLEIEKQEIAKQYGLPPAEWHEEIAAIKAEIKRLSGLIEGVLVILKRQAHN